MKMQTKAKHLIILEFEGNRLFIDPRMLQVVAANDVEVRRVAKIVLQDWKKSGRIYFYSMGEHCWLTAHTHNTLNSQHVKRRFERYWDETQEKYWESEESRERDALAYKSEGWA